jgi:type VI secretion system protein ImpB
LDRVRRPRVQITYDVETNGAMEKKELPFVVGVLADLAGHPDPDAARKPLNKRTAVPIDRDTFNRVMKDVGPRLGLKVQDRLSGQDQKMSMVLNFKHIDDFEPARVAEQIPATKELLEMRQRLTQLMSKMQGKPELEKLLGDILNNTDKAREIAQQMGIDAAPEKETPQ